MRNLLVHAGAAAALALVVNLGLFFAGRSAGADYVVPQGPEQTLTPLGAGHILVGTLLPMAGGTGLLLALRRFAPSRAWTIFVAASAVVVVLSFIPFFQPFQAESKLWLGFMHFTTPGLLVFALARAGAARR